MPNFVRFDDGLSYINVARIRYFQHEEDEYENPVTYVYLVDGSNLRTE